MPSNASDSQQQQQKEQNQRQQQTPTHTPPIQPVALPQQWMPIQYPVAAMVMQHHMLPPQHYGPPPPQPYMPYHQYQQLPHVTHAQQHHQHQGSTGDNKTIWVGDLHHWMDETYLKCCFPMNEVSSIKVIRNKQTGQSEGYGFVEFFSHAKAENVLQTYGSILMPNTDQPFRLNWATFSTGDKRADNVPDLSIFVGDLAADVTDSMLHETFAKKYPSVKAAKVVFDASTGRSKGYGFVRFGDDNEKAQAMTEMNGTYCSSRPMRIGAATPRKSSGYQQGGHASNGTSNQSEGDSTNTTIFVGGLDPNVTDDDLRQPFSQYGEIVSVKIPVGKGCGFVQFANRNNAEEALQKLNGTVIGKQTVRLSWGRNPANKQFRGDFANHWNGAYYGGPVYDGYGYALPPPHDPRIYAAAYGSYPMYGGHQQQVS